MLKWLYHVRPEYPERNEFVKRAPASLRISVVTLLYRSEITVKTAALELGFLNAIGIIGWQGPRCSP